MVSALNFSQKASIEGGNLSTFDGSTLRPAKMEVSIFRVSLKISVWNLRYHRLSRQNFLFQVHLAGQPVYENFEIRITSSIMFI